MPANPIPIEQLREALDYDPETGAFRWRTRPASHFSSEAIARHWNAMFAGKPAGDINAKGYARIRFNGSILQSHRVAWALMTGKDPAGVIDHINGHKADNRFANLRDVDIATNTQNQRQARSDNGIGLLGATRHASGKFQAAITAGGKKIHLGLHDTPEAAHEAYVGAKRKLHEGCTL